MKLEHKSFPVTVLKSLDEAGVLEAIVSVTGNVDSGKEIVMPDFFADSLKTRNPKGVWGHDWTQPVAKTLIAEEWKANDPRLPDELKALGGYYIKGQFNLETQRGKEAYSDIKFGIVDEFSIGYSVSQDRFNKEKGARELVKGEWYEWSPVLVGMNPSTQILSIKSAETSHVDVKAMFEEELAERTNSLWALNEILQCVIWRIFYTATQAAGIGLSFDPQPLVAEALAEYQARVLAAIAEETQEDSMPEEVAYSGIIKSIKSGLASGLTLEKRSFIVASAGEEFARRSTVFADVVKQLAEDGKEKARFRTKEGRTISQATDSMLGTTQEHMKTAIDAMQTAHDHISEVRKMKEPKKSDRLRNLRLQQLQMQAASLVA